MESVILDRRGRPIRKRELTREVAAPSLTGVRTLWGNDSVSYRLTPASLATLLGNAVEVDHRDYLTLAEEMEERDLHYGSVLSTRKLAVTGLPVQVEAASDDKRDIELADAVHNLVRKPAFGDMLKDMMDALGKGYSATEIIWDRQGPQWTPARYEWRDPRFFMFDRVSGRELLLIDEQDLNGVPLPPYKFIVHQPRIKSGLPIRNGLARLAVVGYMCKAYSVKDWMAFAEVFGMPLRLGRYGANASNEDIQTLISAVANIGSDAAAVLPDSMRIEFQQAAQGAGGDKLFLGLAQWWDEQISKGVLGQTMTTDNGSSNAQAQVHDKVRGDIQVDDARQLCNTLNRDLVRPFIDLNYGVQANYPLVTLTVAEPEDIQSLTDALVKLVPLGLEVEASVVRDKLGLPDPATGKNVKLLQAPAGAAPAAPAANQAGHCTHCGTALNAAGQHVDALDALADEALADWEPQMRPIVQPVLDLANNAQTYDEFVTGLADLLDTMDNTELVQALAQAAFKARGMGDATDAV